MPNSLHSGAGDGETRQTITRRRAFDLLLGGSFLSWLAVTFYPVLKYLRRPHDQAVAARLELSDADKTKVSADGFAIVRFGTERVIVFRDAETKLRALQAKCTHEGCTVTYKAGESLVWCACHNGKFAVDGRVISGPPPRPLSEFTVDGEITGKVTLSRKEAVA